MACVVLFIFTRMVGGIWVDNFWYSHEDDSRKCGVSEPEMRLPAMFIYACSLPAGLIFYGWTADKHIH